MGRTIPTATWLLTQEKQTWKPFRNALDKSDRKKFDEMLSLSHMFNYAQMCAIPSHPVPIQPILMTIAFQHYKALNQLVSDLEKTCSLR
jgi:hypothetical protein